MQLLAADAMGVEDPTQELIDAAGCELPPPAPDAATPARPRPHGAVTASCSRWVSCLIIDATSAGMRALIKGFDRAYRARGRRG